MNNRVTVGIVLGAIFLNFVILYYLYFSLASRIDKRVSLAPTALVTKLASNVSSKASFLPFISKVDPTSVPGFPDTEKVDVLASASAEFSDLTMRVDDLEKKVDEISETVDNLEVEAGTTAIVRVPVSSSATANSSIKEITIWFGSGSTNSKEWVDIPGMNSYIDTTKYANIQEARFEAVLRIPNAQGYVHARLFNKSDGHPIWDSEVSSETDEALLKISTPMTLTTGNKLYQVQLKSTIGVEAVIDSGRVKIALP